MTRSAAGPRAGFRSTLRNGYFTRLWIAQIISQTVQNSINYGALVLLTQQSQSFTAVGGVIIAFSLPAVIFGIPAGVLVDRINKRLVLWVSNALRAFAAFGFVVSLLVDSKAFVPIYILTFFISIVGQFFGPAEGAAIPLLVGEGELVPALSLFNITFSVSQALGFIIIGPAIILAAPTVTLPLGQHDLTLTSIHWLFLFISLMYVVCTLLTWSIPARRLVGQMHVIHRTQNAVWHGVVEAWDYVRTHRRLFIAVSQLTLGGAVITVISMIAPLFSTEFLHRPPALAAIVFVPAGLGLISGSALMPRIIHIFGMVRTEIMGVIGLGSSIVLLTVSHWLVRQMDPAHWFDSVPYLAAIIVLIFILGLSVDLINLPAQTLMQQLAPDWIKGRVLALQMMLLNAVQIPIILIIGPSADVLGLAVAMNILAGVVTGLGLLSVVAAERARQHDESQAPPAAPLNGNNGDFKGTKSNPLARVLTNDAADEHPRSTAPAAPNRHP
jgi:MFS family permease